MLDGTLPDEGPSIVLKAPRNLGVAPHGLRRPIEPLDHGARNIPVRDDADVM